MSPYDFAKVVGSSDLGAVTHSVFHEAYEKWITEGVQGLTEGQITVYCVETVFGEVCNGGIEQYLDNESGQLAEYASASLFRVGLEDYAKILQEALLRCEKLFLPEEVQDPDDDDPRTPWVIWSQGEELDPFEDLNERFFDLSWANEGEFRKKLFQYIVEHEDQFLDTT